MMYTFGCMSRLGDLGHGASPGAVGGLLLWALQSQQRRTLPTSPAQIKTNPTRWNEYMREERKYVEGWKEPIGSCGCGSEYYAPQSSGGTLLQARIV